jgi:hypothetical protein
LREDIPNLGGLVYQEIPVQIRTIALGYRANRVRIGRLSSSDSLSVLQDRLIKLKFSIVSETE